MNVSAPVKHWRIWVKDEISAFSVELNAGRTVNTQGYPNKKKRSGAKTRSQAKKRSRGQNKVPPGAPERSTFAERVIFSY
jgi:hypothetical protein